jgi:hypothetical protein
VDEIKTVKLDELTEEALQETVNLCLALSDDERVRRVCFVLQDSSVVIYCEREH